MEGEKLLEAMWTVVPPTFLLVLFPAAYRPPRRRNIPIIYLSSSASPEMPEDIKPQESLQGDQEAPSELETWVVVEAETPGPWEVVEQVTTSLPFDVKTVVEKWIGIIDLHHRAHGFRQRARLASLVAA